MNGWFGRNPFGPLCTKETHVSTPVGELCQWCDEEIEAEDSGVIIPVLLSLQPTWGMRAHHQECFLRETLGSVAHIERRCLCYVPGSVACDPPYMSVREAARAAVQAWLKTLHVN